MTEQVTDDKKHEHTPHDPDERGHFGQSRAQFERALALARERGTRRGDALVVVSRARREPGMRTTR